MQRKNTAVTFIKLLDLNMNLCTSDMHVSTSMSSREMKGELVGAGCQLWCHLHEP